MAVRSHIDESKKNGGCSIYSLIQAVRMDKDVRDAVECISVVDGTKDPQKLRLFNTLMWKLESSTRAQIDRVTTLEEAQRVLNQIIVVASDSEKQATDSMGMSLADFTEILAKRLKITQQKMARNPMNPLNWIKSRYDDKLLQRATQDLQKVTLAQRVEELKQEQEEKAHLEKLEKLREEQRRSEAVRKTEERAVEEERRAEAQRAASKLMRPLTREEKQIAKEAIYGIGPGDEIVAQVGTDTVQRESMHRLQDGTWLNDEVIHYFLVMLAERDRALCEEDPSRKPCHFFKSFFMTKLLNEGHSDPSKDGVYEYKNVKRWSKRAPGKDLFKLDKIIFPINQGNAHWVCAVAHMKQRKIQMYDSMGGSGTMYLQAIFRYLQDEHVAKKGESMPDLDGWQLLGTQDGTPHQQNGFDCGVFTCMFADFVSMGRPLVFQQHHITQCRQRIAVSIMKGQALV